MAEFNVRILPPPFMAAAEASSSAVDTGCPIAVLRTIPDGTSAGVDATEWILAKLGCAFGLFGDEPKNLPDAVLRLFCADAAASLASSVAMEAIICAAMSPEEAQLGSEAALRVSRLCRLSTALWLVLAPVAGGGGLDCIDPLKFKHVSKVFQPFRSALLGQLTRRGDVPRAIALLSKAFLAADCDTFDSRWFLGAPLCGLLRACHQWPLSSPAKPTVSIWSASGFSATRALVRAFQTLSVHRHRLFLSRAAEWLASSEVVEERGAAGSLTVLCGFAMLPHKGRDIPAAGAFKEAVEASSCSVAHLTFSVLCVEALPSAVEALASSPTLLSHAMEDIPHFSSVVQLALHLSLQRKRASLPLNAIQVGARCAVALAVAVGTPPSTLLQNEASQAFVSYPEAVMGVTSSSEAAEKALASVLAATEDPLSARERCMLSSFSSADVSSPPTELPWPSHSSASSAAAAAVAVAAAPVPDGLKAKVWANIADFLPAPDALMLGLTCSPLARLLFHSPQATQRLAEHEPTFSGPSCSRVGVPLTAVPVAVFTAARGLCEREKVAMPPEAASQTMAETNIPPSPVSSVAWWVSPLSRVYWSRRLARAVASARPGAIKSLDEAVASVGGSHSLTRSDFLRPPFPTPETAPVPDKTDIALLFTAPARDLRTVGAGLLGGATELLVKAFDVVDACVEDAASVLSDPKADEPARQGVAVRLRRPMHDAAAAVAGVMSLMVGVTSHASLVAELYTRMKVKAGPAAAEDDPLTLMRAASIIVEQWCNRRLRGDQSRMPPRAAADKDRYRAFTMAARGLVARLLPPLADHTVPAGQSHVFLAAELSRWDGTVETGHVGHPALLAALLRLLLLRGVPPAEAGWAMTQTTLGASIAPILAKIKPDARTPSLFLDALVTSVMSDCELLRRSGGEHFALRPSVGERNPLRMAAVCYRTCAQVLLLLARAFPEVDEAVARVPHAVSFNGKPVTPWKVQVVMNLSNVAECFLRLGQPAMASKYAAAALALDPTHEKSASRLARAVTAASSS
jgi:hypothetical protein